MCIRDSDSGVPAQYAQRVADQCKDARIITVPQGEASKSFKILETVSYTHLDVYKRQPVPPPGVATVTVSPIRKIMPSSLWAWVLHRG